MVATTVIRGEEWLEHRGSVGRPYGCELQIRDDEGRAAGRRSGRDIRKARHPGWRSTPQSREDGGSFSVGDLGWLDEEDT